MPRDSGGRRGDRFVVRVGDQYLEGGRLTSRNFATQYETREDAERALASTGFRNAVVEKISIFD
jgi:hypothetical protein